MQQQPAARTITSLECCFCNSLMEQPKLCGRCRIARYCGADCQKKHWYAHKSVCIERKPDAAPQHSYSLEKLSILIAAHYPRFTKSHPIPSYLCAPIVRKVRQDRDLLVLLDHEKEQDSPLPPDTYDLATGQQVSEAQRQASRNSWSRMLAIARETITNRAVALALQMFSTFRGIELTIGGRPITGIMLYRNEHVKVPLWKIVTKWRDVPQQSDWTVEPQTSEHVWVAFRVAAIDPDATDDILFLDFAAAQFGLYDRLTEKDDNPYGLRFVAGNSRDLRHKHPAIYGAGKLYRDSDYLLKHAQLLPELLANELDSRSEKQRQQSNVFYSCVEKITRVLRFVEEGKFDAFMKE